jgi:hypothetical protein
VGVRCSRGAGFAGPAPAHQREDSGPAVQSSDHLPQREAVATVAGVAAATAINAEDLNQILGDLH